MIFEKNKHILVNMKQYFLFLITLCFATASFAQQHPDSSSKAITITKDERIDVLGKKMAEYNESLATKKHLEKGYRLMILSTTDRDHAIQVRSKLLQQFPDQNVYMSFQSPYIKLKFGDFQENDDAVKMRKLISDSKIVTGNIYIVPEMIEVKPKQAAAEDQ